LFGAKPARNSYLHGRRRAGFGLALETGRGGMSDGGMALNQRNGATMTNLRTLSAAVALAAMLPLATPTASLAAGRGPGPCTPPAGYAVGAAGPP